MITQNYYRFFWLHSRHASYAICLGRFNVCLIRIASRNRKQREKIGKFVSHRGLVGFYSITIPTSSQDFETVICPQSVISAEPLLIFPGRRSYISTISPSGRIV